MQPGLVISQQQRELVGRNGPPIVKRQANPTIIDETLEFGRFRVLVRQRQLLADDVPVELGTRAFDTLMVLIDANGSLVTKDELLTRVWSGVVVEQGNLKVQISAVRKALGDERGFIRTECGRGYRFIAAIRSTAAAPECWSTVEGMRSPIMSEAISPPDLSCIAARLTRLEDRLAEALTLVTRQRRGSRLRRRRRYAVSSDLPVPYRRAQIRSGKRWTVPVDQKCYRRDHRYPPGVTPSIWRK
jgi:DNA-binding winged helix-turn-helix (wHTH) protein